MSEQKLIETSQLVAMASQNEGKMDGATAPVKALIDGHEVVFGIWPDLSQPDGIGVHIIKGQRRIMEQGTSEKAEPMTVTAIPCENLEMAKAAQQEFGEPGLD